MLVKPTGSWWLKDNLRVYMPILMISKDGEYDFHVKCLTSISFTCICRRRFSMLLRTDTFVDRFQSYIGGTVLTALKDHFSSSSSSTPPPPLPLRNMQLVKSPIREQATRQTCYVSYPNNALRTSARRTTLSTQSLQLVYFRLEKLSFGRRFLPNMQGAS